MDEMKPLYWLASLGCCLLFTMPARANLLERDTNRGIHGDVCLNLSALSPATGCDWESALLAEEFTVFPVGLNVGKRTVIASVLVRGQEDGSQAINFENWLISYDAVIQALKLEVTSLPDGQLEVRSPSLAVRINPSQLRNDPELGLVFSIQDLQTLFGVPAEFDINEYAIILNPPWLGQTTGTPTATTDPIQLEGLPRVEPSQSTVAAVEQRVNLNGSPGDLLSNQGELAIVGTLLSGSWYTRLNQGDLKDLGSWNVAEAQYLRQTDATDYVIGSQPTFWRSQSASEYWGVTLIQRQGFTPPVAIGAGGFNPGQRLQAFQLGRTIVGSAEPGTLVRLTAGFSDRILAEVLVDSSGIYRFEDVLVSGQTVVGNYRVLLYPEGRLSEAPEIRDATFSTVPGQIPLGTSARIVSGGFRRQSGSDPNQTVSGLTNFQGGVAQRWGISEDLTVGVGGVYDETIRGIGELFFRPTSIPLELAASVLTGDEDGNWDVNANVRYDPSPRINVQFSSDRLSERLNLNWRVLPRFTLLGTYNSRDGSAVGVQTAISGRGSFTFARATIDTQNRLRWTITQRLGVLEFTQQGNEIGLRSQLRYNLSGRRFSDTGHSLLLSYETRNLESVENLATLGWRYRSQSRTADGNYRWETQFGYGSGSQGSGVIATIQTAVIPGLLLRGRYEGASVTTDQATYSLEVVTSVNLQRGISPGDRQSDRFRTQGGLLIQPFFDRNNNNQRDRGEDAYIENPDLLLIINNQPVKAFRPEVQADRVLVRLPPATYRLDLDPSGFPLDWQSPNEAYAVEVVAGSYTSVLVPLVQSYSLTGVVTNTEGKAVVGARVEAIQVDSGQRRFSVTNGAGVYYLERLQQGTYTLQINGEVAQPETIKLDESSEPFQELNLQQS